MHAQARKEMQERRVQDAQAKTLNEEEKEQRLRAKDLDSLKDIEAVGSLKELRRRARAAGVDPEKLEDAMDTDDPHGAVVGMMKEVGSLSAAGVTEAQVEAKAAELFVDRLGSGITGIRDVATLVVLDKEQRAARDAAILSYLGSADEAVKLPQLLDMGYPRKEAQVALATCNGNLDEAARTLLQTAMYHAIRRLQGVNVTATPLTLPGGPQPETVPEPADEDDDPYLKELHTLRVSSLKRRCIALGATEKQINSVDDAEERGVKRKDAAIELLMELKAGLRKTPYRELKERLRKRGASEEDIDDLDDNDDVMGAAIDKLLESIARDDYLPAG
jgi:hypothetical protein